MFQIRLFALFSGAKGPDFTFFAQKQVSKLAIVGTFDREK